MARWSLEFSSGANEDLCNLDLGGKRRIIEKLDWLLQNFDSILPQALNADFREFFKLRIGDWRVVYKINWNKSIITIHYIDHRSKIYKRK